MSAINGGMAELSQSAASAVLPCQMATASTTRIREESRLVTAHSDWLLQHLTPTHSS
jgi:hypothetical protein